MDSVVLFRQMGLISRRAMLAMNQQAARYGLDNNLFLYLSRIVEREGLTQSDLVELVCVDKTTLSRALQKLEQEGLIVKRPHPSKKRFKQLYPTALAQMICQELRAFEEAYIQQALALLSRDECESLSRLLTKIENPQG